MYSDFESQIYPEIEGFVTIWPSTVIRVVNTPIMGTSWVMNLLQIPTHCPTGYDIGRCMK